MRAIESPPDKDMGRERGRETKTKREEKGTHESGETRLQHGPSDALKGEEQPTLAALKARLVLICAASSQSASHLNRHLNTYS